MTFLELYPWDFDLRITPHWQHSRFGHGPEAISYLGYCLLRNTKDHRFIYFLIVLFLNTANFSYFIFSLNFACTWNSCFYSSPYFYADNRSLEGYLCLENLAWSTLSLNNFYHPSILAEVTLFPNFPPQCTTV